MMYNDFASPPTCDPGALGPSLADACIAPTFFTFMSLLNACVIEIDVISGICERVRSIETPNNEYDFIVVGGGAAGCVIAARLSEICDWKILLLEAGGHEPAGAEIPGFFSTFLRTEFIWNYVTTNESSACLSTNRSCAWPSGKNIGGNMAHNAMIYLRGNPTDYNNWAENGNEGWSWEEVEPYFIKSEDNGEIDRVGREHHGTCGPLPVERFPYLPPFGYSLLAAAEEAGFGISEDLNGDQLTGLSITQSTNKKGVRWTSARAFLGPIRDRKNLHIVLNSTVTRVITENGRAVGVEYFKDGQLNTVFASREVILSAGPIESPHLLLLSGIGPREQLESMNIGVMRDVPGVGQNLQDHPGVPIPYTINDIDTYDNNWAVALQYLANQTGPLSCAGTIQVTGFVASNSTAPDYPDLQLYFSSYVATCAPGEIGAREGTGKRLALLGASYLHPKSRGSVTLASNDPLELPVIQANYLTEPEDLAFMVEGVRLLQAMLDTEALRPFNFTLADPFAAACTDYEFDGDDFWACVIQQFNYALYHQGGTCKMGPSSDPMAVVDPRLRVYGIDGLRVADSSIMPELPSCNTAAPAMMIGERVADFVKQDWGRRIDGGSCFRDIYGCNKPPNCDRTANCRETEAQPGCRLTARSDPTFEESTCFNGIQTGMKPQSCSRT